MTDHFAEVRDSFLVVSLPDVVVGVGIVPVLDSAVVYRVTVHVADDILGVVEPSQLGIAFGQPSLGQPVLQRLCLIEPAHVGEGGGSLVEGTLLELSLAQQHPRLPDKRIVFLAAEPFAVAGGLLLITLPFRLRLDAVQTDGLLALLDGAVIVTLAQFHALLVADHVKGNDFGVVVLVAFLFLQITFYEGLGTIEIGVVTGGERVPETVTARILLNGTGE